MALSDHSVGNVRYDRPDLTSMNNANMNTNEDITNKDYEVFFRLSQNPSPYPESIADISSLLIHDPKMFEQQRLTCWSWYKDYRHQQAVARYRCEEFKYEPYMTLTPEQLSQLHQIALSMKIIDDLRYHSKNPYRDDFYTRIVPQSINAAKECKECHTMSVIPCPQWLTARNNSYHDICISCMKHEHCWQG